MTALGRIASATDPTLRTHAVRDPGSGRFEPLVPDSELAFVLEAVYEGYLMHYGAPRAFAEMDADLRLLAGDALFALGLARLAARGDLDAVAELADLISLSAQAQAEGRSQEMLEELWQATAGSLAGTGGGARAAAERAGPPPSAP